MKKILVFAVLLALLASGCSTTKAAKEPVPENQPDTPSSTHAAPNMGIISNSYKFENVALEDAPQSVADIYEKNKEQLNVAVADDDQYTYIIAMMGQKPTAGYAIKVKYIEDNEEGKLRISVELSEPEKDAITAQVITYPVDIVRIQKTDLPAYAVDTKDGKITIKDLR